MVAYLKHHRRRVVVLGLVGLALVGLALPRRVSARARGGLGTIFAPAQIAVGRIGNAIGSLTRPLVTSWRRGREVEALEAEIDRLTSENAQLLQRQAALERELAEAVALRRTLPAVELALTVAPVIGRDSCTWSRTVTIGRGWQSGVRQGQLVARDGVALGDTALDGARVVGCIAAVGPFHSVVRLVTDPDSVMRAQVVGMRDGAPVRTASGILTGSLTGRTRLRLEYVHRRQDVRPGDVVLTAGYGGVLPAPVVVGRVETVAASTMPLLSDVTVEPAADLASLRRVVIVHERPRRTAAREGGSAP